jgi:hypothetical protein
VATGMRFSTYDRRFLAGIVHQVWRSCQVFVTVALERGPREGCTALRDLSKWAVAQRRELSPRSEQGLLTLSLPALRAGRKLLEDVETIGRRVVEMVTELEQAELTDDQVEERMLNIIEGVLRWTSLMASQLGITRNLKPHALCSEPRSHGY